MKQNSYQKTIINSMNFFQKNIRFILIGFSIIAFIVFYLLSLKLFDSSHTFYVELNNSIGLNEGDFIYTDDEKVGEIDKFDTSNNDSGNILTKIAVSRNVNIPDKSFITTENVNGGLQRQLKLTLVASQSYFDKNDTIPFIENTALILVSEEPKISEEPEIKKPVVADTVKEQVILSKKETRISFKVQFLSSKEMIPIDSKKFKGLKKISFYMDKSLYKYVTGNSDDLSSSTKYCKEIKAVGFPDAFVVAFDGDKRISIKEAQILLNK
jgi:hypothetical protein